MSAFRHSFAAAAVGALIALAAPGAGAADAPITIMVGGINKIIYLPAKLTEVLGYFKDEGLNVELQSQPAGVDAENQLIAGAVQGVVGFYDHTIDLQSKGKDTEAIAVCRSLRMGVGSGRFRAAGRLLLPPLSSPLRSACGDAPDRAPARHDHGRGGGTGPRGAG